MLLLDHAMQQRVGLSILVAWIIFIVIIDFYLNNHLLVMVVLSQTSIHAIIYLNSLQCLIVFFFLVGIKENYK